MNASWLITCYVLAENNLDAGWSFNIVFSFGSCRLGKGSGKSNFIHNAEYTQLRIYEDYAGHYFWANCVLEQMALYWYHILCQLHSSAIRSKHWMPVCQKCYPAVSSCTTDSHIVWHNIKCSQIVCRDDFYVASKQSANSTYPLKLGTDKSECHLQNNLQLVPNAPQL